MLQMNLFPKQKRDTDIENKHMNTKGERRGGMNSGTRIDIYTLLIWYYV